ncbi:unnamed protein product [Ceratitis capitata]|uniref:inositol-polyphosphate 5-phosphatase n=1 Tax=Ceratitis capitata TaxID=7213 RepID=A0A811U8Y5_CERCA|nr:unnamed protein product [Ceratitis capitata]
MRRKALLHTLQRFYNDKNNEPVPYFLFGDFNFRCDSASVIKELTRNLTKHRASTTNANSSKVFYRNEIGENVLIIGKKEFHYVENQGMIKDNWLSKYDRDPEPFNDILCEFEFDFKPSYPFEEDPELPNQYMKTRCPAWCDRVLMSSQIPEISSPKKAYEQYNTMGKSICMGDHKPVYLYVEMKSNKGPLAGSLKMVCQHRSSACSSASFAKNWICFIALALEKLNLLSNGDLLRQ